MGQDLCPFLQQGMNIFSALKNADASVISAYSELIRGLYEEMGSAYDRAAEGFGFSCSGCDENCCEERFYHHTLSEFIYLKRGLENCPEDKRKEIFRRAGEVVSLYAMHDAEGVARRVLCPLNVDGLCSLYDHRLMICRLHGVPYKMRRPDNTVTKGQGCHKIEWDMSEEKSEACMLDRTDLYRQLSGIEIDLRKKIGFNERIKKTIAEMVVDIEELLAK
jgi:Fe-S-cluster containining protein